MKGVWKIATIAGIPVQIHWSFSFLLLWVYYEGDRNGLAWDGILTFGLLMLTLFGCVVLHEFGHALAARYYGVGTKDITLSPIGGVARLDKLPEKPSQEFIVAIAGPMVNVVIALVIGLALWLFSSTILPHAANGPAALFSESANFFPLLFLLNLALVGFNLLPAFPMDGGRMLRSLLSMKLGRLKATRIASLIGRIIAILFLILAVYKGDIVLGFIGLFVFTMAAQEYYMVRMEDIMNNRTVADLYQNSFTKFQVFDPMQSAMDALAHGQEKNFLVFNEAEELCGTLREKEIRFAMEKKDIAAPLQNYLTNVYGAALLEDKIKIIYDRMDNPQAQVLPVYDSGALVGIIDLPRLNNYLQNNVRRRFAL